MDQVQLALIIDESHRKSQFMEKSGPVGPDLYVKKEISPNGPDLSFKCPDLHGPDLAGPDLPLALI